MKKDDFIGLRIPNDIKKELELIAQAEERSLSQTVLRIIKDYLTNKKSI